MISVVVTEPQSGTVLITVRGAIDVVTVSQLEQAINDAITGWPSHVVIDLGDVEFMGVTAIGTLLAGNAKQMPKCHFAVVVNGNHSVSRPLELTGTDEIIELHEELGTALRCCLAEDDIRRESPIAPGVERAHRDR